MTGTVNLPAVFRVVLFLPVLPRAIGILAGNLRCLRSIQNHRLTKWAEEVKAAHGIVYCKRDAVATASTCDEVREIIWSDKNPCYLRISRLTAGID
jgi:hypothetical protein